MNIVPTLPDVHYDLNLGQAQKIAQAVQPVQRLRVVASDQDEIIQRPVNAAHEVFEREALLDSYSQARGYFVDPNLERQTSKALDAYSSVATSDKRDLLAVVLGINEYA